MKLAILGPFYLVTTKQFDKTLNQRLNMEIEITLNILIIIFSMIIDIFSSITQLTTCLLWKYCTAL